MKEFYGPLETKWIETCWVPQTIVFYVELLPAVLALYRNYGRAFEVADVGAGSGAGTDLLQKVTKGLYGLNLQFNAYDIAPFQAEYARDAFPNVRYHEKDFFNEKNNFDLTIVLHALEHIKSPEIFIARILERSKIAIFYVPYLEKDLIPGHIHTVTQDWVRGMPGFQWACVRSSGGWRKEGGVCLFACMNEGMSLVERSQWIAILEDEYKNEMFVNSDFSTPYLQQD